jgi:hypothetical protein
LDTACIQEHRKKARRKAKSKKRVLEAVHPSQHKPIKNTGKEETRSVSPLRSRDYRLYRTRLIHLTYWKRITARCGTSHRISRQFRTNSPLDRTATTARKQTRVIGKIIQRPSFDRVVRDSDTRMPAQLRLTASSGLRRSITSAFRVAQTSYKKKQANGGKESAACKSCATTQGKGRRQQCLGHLNVFYRLFRGLPVLTFAGRYGQPKTLLLFQPAPEWFTNCARCQESRRLALAGDPTTAMVASNCNRTVPVILPQFHGPTCMLPAFIYLAEDGVQDIVALSHRSLVGIERVGKATSME